MHRFLHFFLPWWSLSNVARDISHLGGWYRLKINFCFKSAIKFNLHTLFLLLFRINFFMFGRSLALLLLGCDTPTRKPFENTSERIFPHFLVVSWYFRQISTCRLCLCNEAHIWRKPFCTFSFSLLYTSTSSPGFFLRFSFLFSTHSHEMENKLCTAWMEKCKTEKNYRKYPKLIYKRRRNRFFSEHQKYGSIWIYENYDSGSILCFFWFSTNFYTKENRFFSLFISISSLFWFRLWMIYGQ